MNGKSDLEASCSGFGIDADFALMFVGDDIMADIEAQTSALALRFGGEKGVEDFALNFRRDPRSIIFDFDNYPIFFLKSAQDNLPLSIHGASGVINDIGPNLIKFTPISFDHWQGLGVIADYFDPTF